MNKNLVNMNSEWWAIGSLVNFIWGRLFTRYGIILFLTLATVVAYSVKQPISFIDYLMLPAVASIILFLIGLFFVLASVGGDLIAEYFISKIFKNPDKGNLLHQVIFMTLSVIGFTLATLFLILIRPFGSS